MCHVVFCYVNRSISFPISTYPSDNFRTLSQYLVKKHAVTSLSTLDPHLGVRRNYGKRSRPRGGQDIYQLRYSAMHTHSALFLQESLLGILRGLCCFPQRVVLYLYPTQRSTMPMGRSPTGATNQCAGFFRNALGAFGQGVVRIPRAVNHAVAVTSRKGKTANRRSARRLSLGWSLIIAEQRKALHTPRKYTRGNLPISATL